jgi:hypothetical protein
MFSTKTRTNFALAALLAGAIALPGAAAAHGDRDWDYGPRGGYGWSAPNRHWHDYDRRYWERRGPPHRSGFGHSYRGRPDVVVIERPMHRRPPPPPPRPVWGSGPTWGRSW